MLLRALVASDNCAMRVHLKMSMEENGYRVTEVRSGMEALHVAQLTEPFDIILVDASASILTSIDAVIQIRSLFGRKGIAPVVALVDTCDEKDVARLMDAGYDEVFQATTVSATLLQKCKQTIIHHLSSRIDGDAERAGEYSWREDQYGTPALGSV